MNNFKIIYIIGAGRSGTTLLDIILGNAGNVFTAGELNRFTKRNGIPHDARDENVICFWSQVNQLLSERGFGNAEDYYRLSEKFEYHSSFYRMLVYNKKEFNNYKQYQQALFSAIASVVKKEFDKDIIVDSSKYPLRAYFLSKIFGRKISFIYIRRNPVAVVKSFQKKDVEQPYKNRYAAHTYLLGVNNLSFIILKRLRKYHNVSCISYEGLLEEPLKELAKIEKELLLDLTVSKEKIKANAPLEVGYLFDGNRLRLNKTILFRKTSSLHPLSNRIDHIFGLLHKLTWYKHQNNG